MGEQKDALEFFNKIEELRDNGIDVFSKNIKIGNFGADKGDDVDEQYNLMLDYFQEKGMEMNDEQLYYLIFVLGYDLLHDFFMKNQNQECDLVYEKCKTIVTAFISTSYSEQNKSLYECLQDYIKNNNIQELLKEDISEIDMENEKE